MNKIILAIIISLFSTISFSQKVNIKWGDNFKSTVGILGYEFGGVNGKYYYGIESFKGQSIITVSDLNHNVVKKQTIEYKNNDFRIQVVDYIKTNSNFYFIVRGIDLKNDKGLIGYVTATSDGNVNPNINEILIYDWDIKALNDGVSYLSDDRTKIIITYAPHKKGQSSLKYLTLIFSDKMSKLPNNTNFDGYNFDKIKIDGAKVEDVNIETLSNNKKVAIGTYTNPGNTAGNGRKFIVFGKEVASTMTGINGVFYATLDSNGVTSSKLFPFTEEVAKKMGIDANNLDKGIPELSFQTYFSEKDNNIAIFLEEGFGNDKTSTRSSSVHSSSLNRTTTTTTTNSYTMYHSNSIIASNFNEKGELQFMTVIEKEFVFQNMTDFSSFLPFKKDDNLYLLFNKSKFSFDNKKDVIAKGKFLTDLVKLDSKGNIVSQETLFGNKDVDLLLAPKNCYVMDGNKVLLFGVKGLKFTYGTLEVK